MTFFSSRSGASRSTSLLTAALGFTFAGATLGSVSARAADVQVEDEANTPSSSTDSYERSSTLAPVIEQSMVRNNSLRFAIRYGLDKYLPSNHLQTTGGVDIGLVSNKDKKDRIYMETGFLGTAMVSSKITDIYAGHAYVGPAIQFGPLSLGARMMAGGTWNSTEKWSPDLGGEARLGLVNENLSVNVGVGRTQHFSRLGLDVGILL